ncbi:mannosyltransferase putative-domain-containing protein [Chytriomyces sp. MP71]|nr:mannosyltransferase putative-domain-containing protein [Chytriomyces sp. MP71]
MKLPRRVRTLLIFIVCATTSGFLLLHYWELARREGSLALQQARFLDYLNGEFGRQDPTVFGGSLRAQRGPFKVTEALAAMNASLFDSHSTDYNRTHLAELGTRARSLLIAYTLLNEKPALLKQMTKNEDSFIALRQHLHSTEEQITNLLYPWIAPKFKTIKDLQASFAKAQQHTGIVFTSGQWHFELCVHAIISLRETLRCTLPIEVHYAGPNDLTPDMIKVFNALDNVKTVDVWDHFAEEARHINGWAIKPFAILASRFRQVLFVDADALFFQNPDTLLKYSSIFKETGSLFYADRTVGRTDASFFKSINPHWTNYASTLRYMTHRTAFEMESGVVAIDKSRTGPLHALLLVCKLNSHVERALVYKHVHGDKETFWFAWDMLRVPYRFSPTFGGAAGYMDNSTRICGGIFHTDESLRPLWFNGGVLKNKHATKEELFINFTHVAYDMTGDDIRWEWETAETPFCLDPRDRPQVIVQELSADEKVFGDRYVQLYKDIKKDGWRRYFEARFDVRYKRDK